MTSLFTNIPVSETIEIICNCLLSNCSLLQGLSRSEFENLLVLSVKNCHFIFNGKLYHQIDGVAMGSPLGPLFANIFMSFHEKNLLNNCPSSFKPILSRRYVDDCFLLFSSLDHAPLFLDYLNRQHPNINFTSETECDRKLSFLDIDISRVVNGKLATSVYRKPTFTGLFTNFHSFIPLTYKCCLVSGLLNRIFNICSLSRSRHNYFVEAAESEFVYIALIAKVFNHTENNFSMFNRLIVKPLTMQ